MKTLSPDIFKTRGASVCRLPTYQSAEWGCFTTPDLIVTTHDHTQVKKCIAQIEQAVKSGSYAVGAISYEAAQAFDPAHQVYPLADSTPLLWFALYSDPPILLSQTHCDLPLPKSNGIDFKPELTREEYCLAVDKIKGYITDGDIYQANFTFRARAEKDIAPEQLFLSLLRDHPTPYAAFINTGDTQIVSCSPELFLSKNELSLFSLPMKGTAHRHPSADGDLRMRKSLSTDPKNRAENVMIVDMVRNDLGRICEFGSVKVAPLCEVDTYRTVHQMVSGVEGKLRAGSGLFDILEATFPAASITGAPKIRAMQIIREQEISPRGVYTGSIGCLAPSGDFVFNVAIRTLVFQHDMIELGIGSGIVADSQPDLEWDECLMKSHFVSVPPLTEFSLLETILWRRDEGFLWLDDHIERVMKSARYFQFPIEEEEIRQILATLSFPQSADFARVRLLISNDGGISAEFTTLETTGWRSSSTAQFDAEKDKCSTSKVERIKLKLSKRKTVSSDIFLHHKTTNRDLYDSEFHLAAQEGFDEVIFVNEREEVTEGAISNIFLRLNGQWLTPPLSCGLLSGIWRKHTITNLGAQEKTLTLNDLHQSTEIMIGNSVRGGAPAKF